jgi:hypothetical protein
MNIDMFNLAKTGKRTNTKSELHLTPIVSFGYVVSIVDNANVKVRDIVQRGTTMDTYTVRLLSLGNDAKQDTVEPVLGDTVIVFFVRSYDPAMLLPVQERIDSGGEAVIRNSSATGYDKYSGIGFLAKAMTGNADDLMVYRKDGSTHTTSRTVLSKLASVFRDTVNLVFDAKRGSGGSVSETPVTVAFGAHSPLGVTTKSGMTMTSQADISVTVIDKVLSFLFGSVADKVELTLDGAEKKVSLVSSSAPAKPSARKDDAVQVDMSALNVQALATALLATGAFTPSGSPPAPSATGPSLVGKITAGSDIFTVS